MEQIVLCILAFLLLGIFFKLSKIIEVKEIENKKITEILVIVQSMCDPISETNVLIKELYDQANED